MIKRGTGLSLVVLILLGSSVLAGTYSGGTGELNNPYRIATAADLNDIGNHVEDFNKCFVMVNDVNLSEYTGTEFNIIGPNAITPFTGVFDGNNHTISNFTYQSASSDNIGLFGHVDDVNAEIKDLILIDPNVHGNTRVGSLVGGLANGTITNCNAEGADISGDSFVGGLVGVNGYTILNCYATGTVDGNSMTGGLVGGNAGGGEILNCYATGNVNGNDFTGGLVGHIFHFMFKYPVISNCYATGNVSGNNRHTGGLAGSFDVGAGVIVNCYATGTVDGNDYTGGLVGSARAEEGGMVNCYAAGTVIGDDPNTGGLVGYGTGNYYRKCFCALFFCLSIIHLHSG